MENMKPRLLPSDEEMLERNFKHHPPRNQATIELHEEVRQRYRDLAEYVCGAMMPDRERSLALTKLEESLMWMNACVARKSYDLDLEIEDAKMNEMQ